jgi:hypothetical protein
MLREARNVTAIALTQRRNKEWFLAAATADGCVRVFDVLRGLCLFCTSLYGENRRGNVPHATTMLFTMDCMSLYAIDSQSRLHILQLQRSDLTFSDEIEMGEEDEQQSKPSKGAKPENAQAILSQPHAALHELAIAYSDISPSFPVGMGQGSSHRFMSLAGHTSFTMLFTMPSFFVTADCGTVLKFNRFPRRCILAGRPPVEAACIPLSIPPRCVPVQTREALPELTVERFVAHSSRLLLWDSLHHATDVFVSLDVDGHLFLWKYEASFASCTDCFEPCPSARFRLPIMQVDGATMSPEKDAVIIVAGQDVYLVSIYNPQAALKGEGMTLSRPLTLTAGCHKHTICVSHMFMGGDRVAVVASFQGQSRLVNALTCYSCASGKSIGEIRLQGTFGLSDRMDCVIGANAADSTTLQIMVCRDAPSGIIFETYDLKLQFDVEREILVPS